MAQASKAAALDDMDQTMSTTGVERRERLHHTIKSLMKLRQDVIVSYCQLSGRVCLHLRSAISRHMRFNPLRSDRSAR